MTLEEAKAANQRFKDSYHEKLMDLSRLAVEMQKLTQELIETEIQVLASPKKDESYE